MRFERLRFVRALAVALVTATVAAHVPAASGAPAGNESRESKRFAFVRTAGTCPKAVTVKTYAKGYEGGATIDITVQTKTFAAAPRVVVKTQSRIEFAANLTSPYASCEATARFSDAANRYQLALRAGAMRLIFLPSAELTLLGTSVVSGNPTIKMGVAD
ncbi:MAG: hypothetical protein QOJ39_660 [Candidatus Eremiobacteraeota bacterium]|jgi:hypothetical protein|nr:hypothetical protein [Candidatus Eremiobacteraeota bacterium]